MIVLLPEGRAVCNADSVKLVKVVPSEVQGKQSFIVLVKLDDDAELMIKTLENQEEALTLADECTNRLNSESDDDLGGDDDFGDDDDDFGDDAADDGAARGREARPRRPLLARRRGAVGRLPLCARRGSAPHCALRGTRGARPLPCVLRPSIHAPHAPP